MEHPQVDVAIIGAGKLGHSLQKINAPRGTLKTVINLGLAGIVFARFYLDTHPECRLTILEKDRCIGGVWSAGMECSTTVTVLLTSLTSFGLVARVFDAFWVQSPLRMTSFSDVALQLPKDAPKLYDTFEAKYVTQYLEDYVDSHVYNGSSLRSRIHLNAEVRAVEKIGNEWVLQVGGAMRQSLRCVKLAVASGLTSSPNMPNFPRSHDWMAPKLHHRDFGVHSKKILATSSAYKNITVLGGGKSAADMVYASVKARKNVNWIVRKTGEGPGIFMNPAATGRYRNNAEAGATQKAATLNPSGFHPMPEWAQMLHQSVSERTTLDSQLFASDRRYKLWANYRGREGALPGFRELEPKAS